MVKCTYELFPGFNKSNTDFTRVINICKKKINRIKIKLNFYYDWTDQMCCFKIDTLDKNQVMEAKKLQKVNFLN